MTCYAPSVEKDTVHIRCEDWHGAHQTGDGIVCIGSEDLHSVHWVWEEGSVSDTRRTA